MNFSLSFLRLKNNYNSSPFLLLPNLNSALFKESKFSRFFSPILRTSDQNRLISFNIVSFSNFLSSPVRHSSVSSIDKTFRTKRKEDSEAKFTKCLFKSIHSDAIGGCIETEFKLHILDCTFEKSTAEKGGAIFCSNTIEFIHSFIRNCNARETGGGIYQDIRLATEFTLSSSTFLANHGKYSGAIYKQGTEETILSKCNFTKNKGNDCVAVGELVGYKINVTSCYFCKNDASVHNGGLFVKMSNQARISDSIFYKCAHNSNTMFAGAALFFIENCMSATIINCLFNDCKHSDSFVVSAGNVGRIALFYCNFSTTKMRSIYHTVNARIFYCNFNCRFKEMSINPKTLNKLSNSKYSGNNNVAILSLLFSLIVTLSFMIMQKKSIHLFNNRNKIL